ncbi:F-box domain-containing protein/FBD domain-containing protein [Artemisia annua]|uniref:F-box domain-containing protein/FBD domain-containing protein n=1 Tax=Artemisia annua TaxID=35608 RepID=A0A2U1PR42_ARTAN|nr:F-box domain-containing protein/FBD domain-containing protein [Artemisia annua]
METKFSKEGIEKKGENTISFIRMEYVLCTICPSGKSCLCDIFGQHASLILSSGKDLSSKRTLPQMLTTFPKNLSFHNLIAAPSSQLNYENKRLLGITNNWVTFHWKNFIRPLSKHSIPSAGNLPYAQFYPPHTKFYSSPILDGVNKALTSLGTDIFKLWKFMIPISWPYPLFISYHINNSCIIGIGATVDLSKVTMRKHKKPKDVTGVVTQPITENSYDTSPHVQVENSKGPIAAESSHLNVGTGPSIELNSIKSKHDFIKLVFDVSLNSTSDIDLFLTELKAGKHPIWSNLDSNTRSKVHKAMSGLLEVYEMNTNATKSNSEDSIRDTMVTDSVCEGVNVPIPRSVVEKVSARLEHTLYGYFIGNRMAFPVVEYYVKNNWAKYGLKKIMMNEKGFFFFKFDTQSGLEAVLEGGPWMIRKSPIILKKWSVDTRLCKEELTCIPVWVKLHDVMQYSSKCLKRIESPVQVASMITIQARSITTITATASTISTAEAPQLGKPPLLDCACNRWFQSHFFHDGICPSGKSCSCDISGQRASLILSSETAKAFRNNAGQSNTVQAVTYSKQPSFTFIFTKNHNLMTTFRLQGIIIKIFLCHLSRDNPFHSSEAPINNVSDTLIRNSRGGKIGELGDGSKWVNFYMGQNKSSKSGSFQERKVFCSIWMDRISNLPNELLAIIISSLNTKEAVSTCVLSKRWKDVWFYLYNLDFHVRSNRLLDLNLIHGILNRLNSQETGKFRLTCEHRVTRGAINDIICDAIRRKAYEMHLDVICLELPSSFFTFDRLTDLKLTSDFTDQITVPRVFCLPNLTSLTFMVNRPPFELTENLFRNCPKLEILVLGGIYYSEEQVYDITCPSLKVLRITLSCANMVYDTPGTVLLDLPKIELLYIEETYGIESADYVIKGSCCVELENDDDDIYTERAYCLLRGISGAKSLLLDGTTTYLLSKHPLSDVPTLQFQFLTCLEIGIPRLCGWALLFYLLENSPILQTLTIHKDCEHYASHSNLKDPQDFDWTEPETPPSCLQSHLEVIKITGYFWMKCDTKAMKYLLGNAKALKHFSGTRNNGWSCSFKKLRGYARLDNSIRNQNKQIDISYRLYVTGSFWMKFDTKAMKYLLGNAKVLKDFIITPGGTTGVKGEAAFWKDLQGYAKYC